MKLINYQEDIVLHVAEIVLQDRPDVEFTQEVLLDTAAYVLNRLRPRYIVSERGFTRLMAGSMFDDGSDEKLENLVELLMLINSAVDVVKKRRSSSVTDDAQSEEAAADDSMSPHWHNIPYLIGRVVDNNGGKALPGIQVTLLVDDKKVRQAGTGWTNPYVTGEPTGGFYSFLPAPIHAEEQNLTFNLKIVLEGKSYKTHTIEQTVETHGEYAARLDFRNDGFINLGTTGLHKGNT